MSIEIIPIENRAQWLAMRAQVVHDTACAMKATGARNRVELALMQHGLMAKRQPSETAPLEVWCSPDEAVRGRPMRHIKYLLFVLALVTGVGHAEAQSTRSALTLVNNSLFTTNGVGAITGKTANGWNQQILASFGSLTDANSWTGSNTWTNVNQFLGTLELNGAGYVYANGPGSPVTFSLFVPTGSLSGTLQAAQFPALTGDATNTVGSLALTLATVNSNTGSFGGASSVPNFTVNAKGLVTAAGATPVIAPAGTLTGTLATSAEPAHTGDVTNSAGSLALTVSANAVTNAKMAPMGAGTFKCNATGGAANPTDCSLSTTLFGSANTWTAPQTFAADANIGSPTSFGTVGYLYATFLPSNSSLYLLASNDGTNWSSLSQQPIYSDPSGFSVGVHDPSIMRYTDGNYYVAYTTSLAGSFGVASSPNLSQWSLLTRVNTSGISGVMHTWSPEWFTDNAGGVHIFFAANTVSATNAGFQIYETHPVVAGAFSGSWSTPVAITGTALPSNMIDPFVVQIGSTYYLWYTNGTAGLSGGTIEYATSSSLTSGYTIIGSGNWTGWGTSGIDGEMIVQTGPTSWLICVENSNYSAQEQCATSANNFASVSALSPIAAPLQAQHGTIIPIQSAEVWRNVGLTQQQFNTGTTANPVALGATNYAAGNGVTFLLPSLTYGHFLGSEGSAQDLYLANRGNSTTHIQNYNGGWNDTLDLYNNGTAQFNGVTGGAVAINAGAAANSSVISFWSQGVEKWLVGLQTDLSFFAYDFAQGKNWLTNVSGLVTLGEAGNKVQIVGATDASSGAAGYVGELVASTPACATTGLTTSVQTNVGSVSLTAGDWDVEGNIGVGLASTTVNTYLAGGLSTTTATLPAIGSPARFDLPDNYTSSGTNYRSLATGRLRVNVSSTTTVYGVVVAAFSASTAGACGSITARRVR